MEVENDRLVLGKDCPPMLIGHAVRVMVFGDQAEEIDDVDEADLEVGEVLAQKCGGS